MHEVQVRRGGTWVPDSLFEDQRLAAFVAHRLEERLGDADVRVVKGHTGAHRRSRAKARSRDGIGTPHRARLRLVGFGGIAAVVAVVVVAVLAI